MPDVTAVDLAARILFSRGHDLEALADLSREGLVCFRGMGQNVDVIIGGPPCQTYSLVGRARSENNMKRAVSRKTVKDPDRIIGIYIPLTVFLRSYLCDCGAVTNR